MPVGSNLPFFRTPWVSLSWATLSLALFYFVTLEDLRLMSEEVILFSSSQTYQWAIVPAESNPFWKFFTYQFMHASWMHLLGNMWYLLIFGWILESAIGSRKFLLLSLVGGAIAVCSELVLQSHMHLPIVGASGVVAVLMGCLLSLFPRAKIRLLFLLVPLPGQSSSFFVPLRFLVYFWLLLQASGLAVHLWVDPRPIAYATHLFGFVTGLFLGLVLRFTRHGLSSFVDIDLSGRDLKKFYDSIEHHREGDQERASQALFELSEKHRWTLSLQIQLFRVSLEFRDQKLAGMILQNFLPALRSMGRSKLILSFLKDFRDRFGRAFDMGSEDKIQWVRFFDKRPDLKAQIEGLADHVSSESSERA